ncbi:hypothetical protein KO495_05060 [Colwellia sp. D2M02]|uniref:pilus assembly PilX family protein n=1 Tax=Colwellia sp. D2M02 TaxID=2841562 RepID=UPI001C094A10|nr:pilus assembly PilX N-terminal domain-containing protein [Colwellia sp. D2M02]MBU2892689.1 hypothetical protein [Colwellia sp. D2M02]
MKNQQNAMNIQVDNMQNSMLTNYKAKQGGFTLITVLILSSLASILVLSSLRDNVNQERLSGNYQKKLNARLVSEQGVFDYIAAAQAYIANNPSSTLAELTAALAAQESGTGTLAGTQYSVTPTVDGGELILASDGNRFEGLNRLTARIAITPGGASSPFADAVVGCDGVGLGGGGKIDSFDSSDPTFSGGADVSTINPGADVDVSSGSSGNAILVDGDINSTGDINLGTSVVSGNLHANGSITIATGSLVERVGGNVLAGKNFTITDGIIGGYVRVNEDAKLVRSDITNTAQILPDILYGGTYTPGGMTKDYTTSEFNVHPHVSKVKEYDPDAALLPGYDKTDPAINCDHLSIESKVDVIDNVPGTLYELGTESSSVFTFTESNYSTKAKYTTAGDNRVFSSVQASVLGEVLPVIKMSKLYLGADANAVISGDVTLYLTGDFTLTGGSKMTILEGSSLTLITKGKVSVNAGSAIVAEKFGFTDGSNGKAPRPVMSIYSSYSDTSTNRGIILDGAGEFYAAIYAPLTNIELGAGTTLLGAMRGKTVKVDGGAKIRHDNVLTKSNGGGGSSSTPVISFVGFQY